MRTFEYVCFKVASSSYQHMHCFAITEIKSDFKCAFLQLYLKNVHYALVMIVRFCHR